ncbi:MAG: DUF3072 domain-containing protein [Pseudolabrys sp.]
MASQSDNAARGPTLSTGAGARMTAEQAAELKTLAHAAYDFEAFGPNLTQEEARRRIATLRAKLALQGEPPHTQ